MLWNPEATPEDGAVDGGGAQVVQGERDCGLDARYDTPDDRGGAADVEIVSAPGHLVPSRILTWQ